MGREIKGRLGKGFAPSVMLKEKIGNFLRGRFLGRRDFKASWGPSSAFVLELIDTNAPTKAAKVEVDVQVGEKVEVLGSTVLNDLLDQVQLGEDVTITYKGEGPRTKGNPPHLFDVVVN